MTHIGFPPFDFVVDLDRRLRSRLHLPDSFAAAVDTDDDRPTGYWPQVEGCPNGPSWVEAEYTIDGSMLLGKGWKAFACSRHLTRGQYLSFEYDGDEMLMHLKCIHELCTIIVIFQSYLHHIRVILLLFNDF